MEEDHAARVGSGTLFVISRHSPNCASDLNHLEGERDTLSIAHAHRNDAAPDERHVVVDLGWLHAMSDRTLPVS
jgi:hypothetical protein